MAKAYLQTRKVFLYMCSLHYVLRTSISSPSLGQHGVRFVCLSVPSVCTLLSEGCLKSLQVYRIRLSATDSHGVLVTAKEPLLTGGGGGGGGGGLSHVPGAGGGSLQQCPCQQQWSWPYRLSAWTAFVDLFSAWCV